MRRPTRTSQSWRTLIVVGPDGTGKSTFISTLLAGEPPEAYIHVHSHPRTLPWLRKRAGRGAPTGDPHIGPPHSSAKSLAKIAVVWLDWVAFSAKRAITRDDRPVLIERGWWDQRVDPRRYRLDRESTWLVGLLGAILPRPDVAVLLSPDPDEVFARKQELNPHEIRRQLKAWHRLLPRAGRALVVRADSAEAANLVKTGPLLTTLGGPRMTGRRIAFARGVDAREASRVWAPGSAKGRLAKSFGLTLIQARIHSSRCDMPPHVIEAWADYCAARPGKLASFFAFESATPARWIISATTDRDATNGRTSVVLKVGSCHDAGLANELKFLARNWDGASSFRVPSIAFESATEDYIAVATPHCGEPTALPDSRIVEISEEIQRMGLRHGDLAPWNIVVDDGAQITILDWESAEVGNYPGHDLIHYFVKRASLLRKTPPEVLVNQLLSDGSPLEQVLQGYEGVTPHRALLQYLNASHVNDQSELAREYRGQLLKIAGSRS